LFHPDVTVHFIGGTYEWKLRGRAEYLAAIQQSFHSRSVAITTAIIPRSRSSQRRGDRHLVSRRQHVGTGPEELRDGHGDLLDRYRKVDGKWLIADTKYERIYEMNQHLSEDPKFHASYLAKYGQELHE
jgi:hypothetical protein